MTTTRRQGTQSHDKTTWPDPTFPLGDENGTRPLTHPLLSLLPRTLSPASTFLSPASCVLASFVFTCNHCIEAAPCHPFSNSHRSSTLAWKTQPRIQGRFASRPRADTITLSTITTPNYDSSFPPSPTTESSIAFEEDSSEFSFADPLYSDLPILPPPPTNTPTPPSPKPQTPPRRTMQLENIPEFSGTQEDKNQPSDFLKAIKRAFLANGTETDIQKVGLLELYLKSDSPAEEWYNDAGTLKKTWAELEQAFKGRFPNTKKATKTAPELERELGAMRITTEEMGKTERYRGEDVYTHMIFAEKILDLAKRAKIETSTSGLWNVRDELPEVLREKIPEAQTSWTAFAQAIKDVDMGHIREGVRKYKDKAASDAQVKADINLLKQRTANVAMGNINSPTKAIRTQLANTTITQATPQPIQPVIQGNPFSSASGGGGNLFGARTTRPPATETEKATLKASIAAYPIQTGTPEGETAYLNQLRTWRQINGDNHVSKSTGFPLRPGGAPPASGECYNCGQTGHRRMDCQTTGTKRIPLLEANFRAICGSILGQPSRRTAQMNYVAMSGEDEFAWLNTASNESQGNGEGPSAL